MEVSLLYISLNAYRRLLRTEVFLSIEKVAQGQLVTAYSVLGGSLV